MVAQQTDPTPSRTSSRAFRIAVTLVLASIVVLFVQMLGKAYRPQGYDFTAYLLAADALREGGNPYALDMPFPYIYPLTLATLVIPLTLIPYWLANAIWFFVGLAGLLGCVYVVISLASPYLGERRLRDLSPRLALLFFLLLHPIQQNLLNGQANFLSLGFLATFLAVLVAGAPLVAAVALAGAVSVKLVPAVLLVFLVVDRRVGTAALTFVGLVFLLLVPGLMTGTRVFTLYSHYFDQFLVQQLTLPSAGEHVLSYSLSGTVTKVLRFVNDGPWTKLACALALLFPVVAVQAKLRRSPAAEPESDATSAWLVCLYLALIPLLSPMSEAHHLAFVIPGAVLVSLIVSTGSRRGPAQTLCVLVFWIALLLAPFTRNMPPFSTVSLYFVALVALYLALLLPPRHRRGGVPNGTIAS